jgi:hypothetical protein
MFKKGSLLNLLIHELSSKGIILELMEDINNWDSIYVDYHKPFVERLYCTVGKYRISLHYIHPCEIDDALLHPHPWSSAFIVLDGLYRTGMGYSNTETPPPIMSSTLCRGGGEFLYDISDPNLWHYVAPVKHVSTVMITDTPYDKEEMNPACKKADKELFPLSDERKLELFEHFKKFLY